jgi:tetratricopeptide (TPR) repeat protein
LILHRDWPEEWVRGRRDLAAQVPGLALVDSVNATAALAAADVVISDGGSLPYEALVLGKGVVLLEGARDEGFGDLGPCIRRADELGAALESVIPGTAAARRFDVAREKCRLELLSGEADAATRMARQIQLCLRGEGSGAPEIRSAVSSSAVASNQREILDGIEARACFGDSKGALSALEDQIQRNPSPRAYCLMVSIQREQGRSEEARQAIDRAEQLARADLGLVLCGRGRVHVDAGEIDAARGAFEEAARLAPANADPWVGLGSLALHAQDAESARVWSGLGLALVGQRRGREALPCFESALDQEPESLAAIHGLVQAAFQSGELGVAERRVRAYVELHSGNLDLAFALAGLRFQLGDRPGTYEMIERIELFKPDYPGLVELREKLER